MKKIEKLLKIFWINETLVITNDLGWWCFDVFAKCSRPKMNCRHLHKPGHSLSWSGKKYVNPGKFCQFFRPRIISQFLWENCAHFEKYFFPAAVLVSCLVLQWTRMDGGICQCSFYKNTTRRWEGKFLQRKYDMNRCNAFQKYCARIICGKNLWDNDYHIDSYITF